METVASPETSGKEEGEFSCSGDVDILCLVSLVNKFTFQLPKRNFENTVLVLKFPYLNVCAS